MQSLGTTLDWLFPKKPAAPAPTGDWFSQNAPAPYVAPGAVDASGNPFPGASPTQDVPYPTQAQATAGGFSLPPGAPQGGYGQPAAPGSTPSPTGAGSGGIDAFERAWMSSGGRTVTDLQNFVKAHPEFGAKLGGSKGDKVYGPDGTYWADAVISAGLGGGQGATFDRSTGGGGSAGGGIGLGDFGSLAQGWDKQFVPPTVDEIRQTPGYQFALTQGIDALDKNLAARGTVLGGGEKKDVLQYATGLADQTAQQSYQNKLGEYMNAYSIARNDKNDIFNRFDTLSNRGTQAALGATG